MDPITIRTIENYPKQSGWSKLMFRFPKSFYLVKSTMVFHIQLTTDHHGGATQHQFSISFSFGSKIAKYTGLKIQKRGRLDKMLGTSKGDFSQLGGNFKVTSKNSVIATMIFDDRKSRSMIERIMSHTNRLDMSTEIVISIPRDSYKLFDLLLVLVELQNLIDSKIGSNKFRQILLRELKTSSREYAGQSCVICYQQISVDDFAVLMCCQSVGHHSHFVNWFQSSENCPYCRFRENKVQFSSL